LLEVFRLNERLLAELLRLLDGRWEVLSEMLSIDGSGFINSYR
jgi:hypothetical protein